MRHPYAGQDRRRSSRWNHVPLVVAVAVAVMAVGFALISYHAPRVKTVTICSKERVAVQDGGEYRLYGPDGAFVMKDSMLGRWRFNTADDYGKIRPETTYRVEVKGWRIPFFSSFENILDATPLPPDQQLAVACSG